MAEGGEEDGGDVDMADKAVSFAAGRLSRGGALEDEPRKGEVTSRRPVSPRAHSMPLFTMPSKGATQGLFEVPDHPAGSLETRRH